MDGQTKTNIPNTPKCCCFSFKQNRQEKYLTYLCSEVKNPCAVRTQLESSSENTYECYLRNYRISNTVDS